MATGMIGVWVAAGLAGWLLTALCVAVAVTLSYLRDRSRSQARSQHAGSDDRQVSRDWDRPTIEDYQPGTVAGGAYL